MHSQALFLIFLENYVRIRDNPETLAPLLSQGMLRPCLGLPTIGTFSCSRSLFMD